MQKIILSMAVMVFALLAFTVPSDKILSGKITDKDGADIPFATVAIKGTRSGVSADAKGLYSIRVKENDVLVFSAPGYLTKEINVAGLTSLNIVLEKNSATSELKEVVVTSAFSSKRARSVSSGTKALGPEVPAGRMSGATILNSTVKTTVNNSPAANGGFNREGYDYITENAFLKAKDNPLSTFSIDVDAASYSNIRRMLTAGQLPPAGAVRIEEMVNYFKYQYPQPLGKEPFSVNTEISSCPWNPQHRLALIGLQGKIIPTEQLPAGNIVFLIDVSGSMWSGDKLPLLKQSLKLLVDQLREQDKVSLCVYAGNAGLVLPATNGLQKQQIKAAIDALEAGGSTAGGAGIQLAYKTAKDNFIKGGNNRVILCTDGDFNVGMSSDDELERLIEKERASGVFLTVLGFGTGNYQDAKMQKLADKGNGNHAYIDQLSEAKKVLVSEFGGTLFTIAKDVKLQIEFNPALVNGYRLIGYENRMLAKEDFNDDKKDAGELGSGHTVTALYEIIPAGVESGFLRNTDSLKYQPEATFPAAAFRSELMTVKLRYKQPDGDTSSLMEVAVKDPHSGINTTSANYRFAAAVAEFGMLLRNSAFAQQASYKDVISLAGNALGEDKEGYRKEFVDLVRKAHTYAKRIKRRTQTDPENDPEAENDLSAVK